MGRLETFEDMCIPYLNKDKLMSGNPVSPNAGRVCDNHSMFTAEYHRIRKDLGATDFDDGMYNFLNPAGQLLRYPGSTTDIDTSPDDYLGILNFFSLKPIGQWMYAKKLLDFGLKHFGCYTPPWNKDGFVWRQPQLLTAVLAASGHIKWYSLWYLPLVMYTALVIVVAGIKADPLTDQDTRRLSWHLIQIMKGKSILCSMASKIWWHRLKKQYGNAGMRLVFSRYFSPSHPFAFYAINQWEQ